MSRDPFAKVIPSDYQLYNRGDMYVPSGVVTAPLNLAVMATPFVGRLMNVHAAPTSYAQPKANVRPKSSFGMATPEARV